MYDFIDTTTHTSTVALPAEAVSIDGTYIENVVEGYRTLYVKGRESLGTELNTYTVGTADGEKIKGRRYPARVLTVGFQLLADTNAHFRERFNKLNNILSIGEADFVFNDETDKFFTGYAVMNADIDAGRNNVTGEWQIYCAYPFKRSTTVTTLSSTDAQGVVVDTSSATFTFTYNGTQPARPVLRCAFASGQSSGEYTTDGDCGYVAFLDNNGHIIQLGNPDILTIDSQAEANKNTKIVNKEFTSLTGWTQSSMTTATISDPQWNGGTGQSQKYAKTSTTGATGTLYKSTSGAVGMDFRIVHRLCTSDGAGGVREYGQFEALTKNNGVVVVGFRIKKDGGGTQGRVEYILNDTVVGTDTIDLSYYNTNFGYCKKIPIYANQIVVHDDEHPENALSRGNRPVVIGYEYTRSTLNSGWTKDGASITFNIGRLPKRTFKNADIANTSVTNVTFGFNGNLNTNALHSCTLIAKPAVPFSEIPNVFTAGDVVEADCNDANVYLYRSGSSEGSLASQYGALGNDWETFTIRPGSNVIKAVWSEWVNTSYKPTVQIMFNGVYI